MAPATARHGGAAQQAGAASRGHHAFRILVYGFQVKGLDVDERCQVYLVVDFAGFKAFRTDCGTGGGELQWDFEAGFDYALASLEKLGCQELRVQCLSRTAERPLGEAAIDLATVAAGPCALRLTLRDRSRGGPVGQLEFNCQMKMRSPNLTLTCTDLRLADRSGAPVPAKLVTTCSLQEAEGTCPALTMPYSEVGHWPGPCSLSVDTTLGDLLKAPQYEYLRFVTMGSLENFEGEALVHFRRAFTVEHGVGVPFRVPVVVGQEHSELEDAVVGELTGTLMYQSLPVYAQMVGGACVDGQIEGGFLLIEGLPYPGGAAEPPPVWRDAQELHEEQHDAQCDEDFEFLGLDQRQLAEALEQIPLPQHWELRYSRGGARVGARRGQFGRPYFADPRSRRTTWIDPRLLPEGWDQRIDPQTAIVYYQYHNTRQTTHSDPRACPAGWEMHLSKRGDVYFAYEPTGQTTFIDPRGLPEHVDCALDPHGRMYFRDHTAQTTTWEDPRDREQPAVLARWKRIESIRWWQQEVWRELEKLAAERQAAERQADMRSVRRGLPMDLAM